MTLSKQIVTLRWNASWQPACNPFNSSELQQFFFLPYKTRSLSFQILPVTFRILKHFFQCVWIAELPLLGRLGTYSFLSNCFDRLFTFCSTPVITSWKPLHTIWNLTSGMNLLGWICFFKVCKNKWFPHPSINHHDSLFTSAKEWFIFQSFWCLFD